jgi:hypothetical protein
MLRLSIMGAYQLRRLNRAQRRTGEAYASDEHKGIDIKPLPTRIKSSFAGGEARRRRRENGVRQRSLKPSHLSEPKQPLIRATAGDELR